MADGFVMVEDEQAASALAGRLAGASRLAVDLEANSFHAYRARICLVQLAWESGGGVEVALGDVLAVPALMDVLRPLLENPALETVLHGADNDVRMLYREFDIALAGLFDTQIAARVLGFPRTGLAVLAEELAGVTLSKAGQKLDWGRRPLPESALRYAATDVRVLLPIRDALAPRLVEAARGTWAREECELLEASRSVEQAEVDLAQLAGRVSGASRLDARRRGVFLSLLAWREAEAARRDVPAFHVVPPKQLLRIAELLPRERRRLEAAGLSPRLVARHGKGLLEAVARGLSDPPEEPPRRRSGNAGDAAPGGLLRVLRACRAESAERLGLDEGTLCTSAVLKAVARSGATEPEALAAAGMRCWQIEAFGEELLETLRNFVPSD